MSDNEDFDTDFQGLNLRKPSNFSEISEKSFIKPLQTSKLRRIDEDEVDDWFGDSKSTENPKKSPNYSYDSNSFSGSFLEEALFAKGRGFGDYESENNEEDVENSGNSGKSPENPEKEEFVGIDWDASGIFKNLACPETDSEKSVCVLRLHDVLTKTELGVQKMTRQMMNCGKRISDYSAKERRDFGFCDDDNLKTLERMLISLRSSVNLMLLETEDLEKSINPSIPIEKSQNFPKKYLFLGGILTIAAIIRMVA